jgi:hypothetical protein
VSLSPEASAPIASEIGHGAPGLRNNLRPFSELVLASASQKQVFVELRPVRYYPTWAADSTSGVYVVACSETWAGIARDVVGVQSTYETFTRAETLALCRATVGTYFFDPDGGTSLYVHPGGYSPNDHPTVAQLGFYYGSSGGCSQRSGQRS